MALTLTLWIFNFSCYVTLQHVKVLDFKKLEVVPPGDRSRIHFELHSLKNLLPLVVVKVRLQMIFVIGKVKSICVLVSVFSMFLG